ncbi:PaaI family thioesterase [Patulibacter minatonensis]|uniref:PaaI family thioesterase n=1 Tax=Patulibacter minatonensis TaxID=298163 RepID=UPI0004AC8B11|nr:PaaI family thioesterase [Patulibacter minatonensis]
MSVRPELPPSAPLPAGDDGPMRPHTATCFGCGPENPASLGLSFVRDGDVVRADVALPPAYEGAPGLAHGGIVAAILDDISGAIPRTLGLRAVTAKLDVEFASPVVIGRSLVTESWLEARDGRKIRIVARLMEGERLLASARALFIEVPPEHFRPRDADPPARPTIAP